MAKRSKAREYAELIHAALEAIPAAEEGGQLRGNRDYFVKVERVMRRKTMAPTDRQAELLRFLRRKGFIPQEWIMGMHFGIGGGLAMRLMAAGRLIQATENGHNGYRVVD